MEVAGGASTEAYSRSSSVIDKKCPWEVLARLPRAVQASQLAHTSPAAGRLRVVECDVVRVQEAERVDAAAEAVLGREWSAGLHEQGCSAWCRSQPSRSSTRSLGWAALLQWDMWV